MVQKSEIIFVCITTLLVIVVMTGIYIWRNDNPFRGTLPRNAVIIFNCSSIEPASLDLKIGDVVNFINAGDAERQISIDGTVFLIKAGETKEVKPTFSLGPASYGYDCDSVAVAGQIQAVSGGQGESLATISFREYYDSAPRDKKPCLRAALGEEFTKAYNDSSYIPKDVHTAVDEMEKCFAVNGETQ